MNSVPEEEGCAVVYYLSPYPRVTAVHYLYIVILLGGGAMGCKIIRRAAGDRLQATYRMLVSWGSALTVDLLEHISTES